MINTVDYTNYLLALYLFLLSGGTGVFSGTGVRTCASSSQSSNYAEYWRQVKTNDALEG